MDKISVMLLRGADVPTVIETELARIRDEYPNESLACHRSRLAEFCWVNSIDRQTLAKKYPRMDLKNCLGHETDKQLVMADADETCIKYLGIKEYEGGAVQLCGVTVVKVDSSRPWTILTDSESTGIYKYSSERVIYLDEFGEPGSDGFCAHKSER